MIKKLSVATLFLFAFLIGGYFNRHILKDVLADAIQNVSGTASRDTSNVWRWNRAINALQDSTRLIPAGSTFTTYPTTLSLLAACHDTVAAQVGCLQWDAAWLYHLSDDSISSQSHGLGASTFNYTFNGTTWSRVHSGNASTFSAAASPGTVAVSNYLRNPNATTWSIKTDGSNTQFNDAHTGQGIAPIISLGFNAATYDRLTTASATNLTAATSIGTQTFVPLSTWSVTNTPAAAAQATASKALGGGTVRHVATSITACSAQLAAGQTPIAINLRDGATGAGTVLRTWKIASVLGDSKCVEASGLAMIGTANTAMTIEFAAAGVAGSEQTVTLTGFSVP